MGLHRLCAAAHQEISLILTQCFFDIIQLFRFRFRHLGAGGGGGGAGGSGGGGAGGTPNFIVMLATRLFELYLLVNLPPVQQLVPPVPCGNGYLAEALLVIVWSGVPR